MTGQIITTTLFMTMVRTVLGLPQIYRGVHRQDLRECDCRSRISQKPAHGRSSKIGFAKHVQC